MKKIIKDYHNFLKNRFKDDVAVLIVELIYVLLCIGSGIYFAILGRVQNTAMSFFFPVIVLAACIFEWKANVRGGVLFYIVFLAMCSSNILGNGYSLYVRFFPYFDKIMHTLSGIAFTCFGYMLVKMMIHGDDGKKFACCLFFGIVFAMAVAAVWEVYEYFVSEVLLDDMQTNYIVDTIDYENYIVSTIINFQDGTSITVDGYIDIGLFDTLQDITVCLIGGSITVVLLVLDNLCFKRAINKVLVPRVLSIDVQKNVITENQTLQTEKETA